jgi:hypothetical protein
MNILKTIPKKPQQGFSIAFGVILMSAMILGIYIAMSDKVTNEILRENTNTTGKTEYLTELSKDLNSYYMQHAGEIDSMTGEYPKEKLLAAITNVKYGLQVLSTERMYHQNLCNETLKINTPDCVEFHDFYVWVEDEIKSGSKAHLKDNPKTKTNVVEFVPPLTKNETTGLTCSEGALDQDARCFVPYIKISGFNIEGGKVNAQMENLKKLAQGFESFYTIKRKQNPGNNSLINYFRQEDGSYGDTYGTGVVNRNEDCGGGLQPHNSSDNRYFQQIPCINGANRSFQTKYTEDTKKPTQAYNLPNSMTTNDSRNVELHLFEDLRDLYDPIVRTIGLESALLNTEWRDTIQDRNVYFSNTGRSSYVSYPYSASFVALAPWFYGKNKIAGQPNGFYEVKAIATE